MNELPRLETCREWVEKKWDRCNEPAVAILWGKLFPKDALGPRCEEHTVNHCSGRDLYEVLDSPYGWAVYDLRPVNALHDG